jgi:Protein of unknown function (DUF1353)
VNINLSFNPAKYEEWVLTQPYVRETTIGSVKVPVGFVTDLASIPMQLWRRFPRWGRWSGAAIVHDYLYRHRPDEIDRETADKVFLELMREDQVRYGDYTVMYAAVREFGSRSWNRYRKEAS